MQDYHVLKMDATAVVAAWRCTSATCPGHGNRCGPRCRLPAATLPGQGRRGPVPHRRGDRHAARGPFVPVKGAYSIDPAVFEDEDGATTCTSAASGAGSWEDIVTTSTARPTRNEGSAPALGPRVVPGRLHDPPAKCRSWMSMASRCVRRPCAPLLRGPWLHRYQGRYLSRTPLATPISCATPSATARMARSPTLA